MFSSANFAMMDMKWCPIEPLDSTVEGTLRGDLAALDTQHRTKCGSWYQSTMWVGAVTG